jgi:F420-non-reducing hydrogenase small subunit
MEKLKFGFYWAASCGGCEIAILDINEKILDVLEVADVVFWPVAMDIKYRDVEAMADGHMDVCFFNGAIRTEEQEHMARLMRGKANVTNRKEIFDRAYLGSPSTVNSPGITPECKFEAEEGTLTLPEFHDTVKALDQVVDVDYYVPGCPPPTGLIAEAVMAIIKGELPPKGSVLAPLKSVCDECPREREEKKIAEIKRIVDFDPDREKCLLEQGIVCMGPATRGGCEARCLNANMPCTGCGGPCPEAMEQGSAMISALSTVLGLASEKEEGFDPDGLMGQLKDPVGTFYKYGLPKAIINRRLSN